MLVDYMPVLPPNRDQDTFYMDLHASFTVPRGEGGEWDFGLIVCGTATVFLDGVTVLENVRDQVPGGTFFGLGRSRRWGGLSWKRGGLMRC
jgi:beta-glucosidase